MFLLFYSGYSVLFCVYIELLRRVMYMILICVFLSGVPDYFGRNKISSGGDLSHYSSASLY